VWAHLLSLGGSMSNPFDYREIMKAHMQYNETRTVEQVLADQKAREKSDNTSGVSKTPPPPGRAATAAELDAARALLGGAKPNNFAPSE
jgi:hypothetical protein